MAVDYTKYITTGLDGAQNAITSNTNPAYPSYTGNQKTNPYANQKQAATLGSSGYDPTKALWNSPKAQPLTQYNGIGQNADQIRSQFMQPVNQAWDKSQGQIKGMYGANGLYGSLGGGLMSGALQDGAQNYMTGTAQANTLANQNIMENEMNRVNTANSNSKWQSEFDMRNELERTGAYRDAYQLQGNQMLDQWKANQTSNEYNNQLLGAGSEWGNSQIDASYADQLARRDDQSAYNQLQIENYLGLANGGSPNAAAQMQANAQKSAAKQAADASNTAAWLGAGGKVAGGLLSSYGDDIWKGISSLWT